MNLASSAVSAMASSEAGQRDHESRSSAVRDWNRSRTGGMVTAVELVRSDLLKLIMLRENLLGELRTSVFRDEDLACNSTRFQDIRVIISQLRGLTLELVEEVQRWRERFQSHSLQASSAYVEQQFLTWGNVNYLIKMHSDLSFLDDHETVSAHIGFLVEDNPLVIPDGPTKDPHTSLVPALPPRLQYRCERAHQVLVDEQATVQRALVRCASCPLSVPEATLQGIVQHLLARSGSLDLASTLRNRQQTTLLPRNDECGGITGLQALEAQEEPTAQPTEFPTFFTTSLNTHGGILSEDPVDGLLGLDPVSKRETEQLSGLVHQHRLEAADTQAPLPAQPSPDSESRETTASSPHVAVNEEAKSTEQGSVPRPKSGIVMDAQVLRPSPLRGVMGERLVQERGGETPPLTPHLHSPVSPNRAASVIQKASRARRKQHRSARSEATSKTGSAENVSPQDQAARCIQRQILRRQTYQRSQAAASDRAIRRANHAALLLELAIEYEEG